MWRVLLGIGIGTFSLWGQGVLIVRSDGGNERFVIAGERFRLKIALPVGIAYGAGCRLWYGPSGILAFAGWQKGDFPPGATLVVPGTDVRGDEQFVDVAALSSTQPGINPVLVELEFVVAPGAPHGTMAQFRAVQAWVLRQDSTVALPNSLVEFPIHGYLQVWPGDANDDGSVDVRDVASVGLYARRGAVGYRRSPASTEWMPQWALAWEQPEATYADCDGNGVVGVRDLAVVLQNYGYRRDRGANGTVLPAIAEFSGRQEKTLRQWLLPADADVFVGIVPICGKQQAGEVRLVGDRLLRGVVVRLDSAVIFAASVQGISELRLVGEGWVCGEEQVQMRTITGEWQEVEGRVLPVEEPHEIETAMVEDGGWICLEGRRGQRGWLQLYSLVGSRIGCVAVPEGEGRWCVQSPVGLSRPVLLVYQTLEGVQLWRLVVGR